MPNQKNMSDDELTAAYDNMVGSVDGLSLYTDEINHREIIAVLEKINDNLMRLTAVIAEHKSL